MSILPDAICNKCSKAASMMCQRCHETYCTTDCQILDWKDHKSKCYQMPNLVPIRKLNAAANRSGSMNESMQSDGMTTMRRPHSSLNNNDIRRQLDHSRRHRDSGGIDGSQQKRTTAYNPLPTNDSDDNNCKPSTLLDDKAFVLKPKFNRDTSLYSSKGAIPKILPLSTKADENVEKSVPAWTTPFSPPVGNYFEAIVQFIEEDPNFIWVTASKHAIALRKLMLEINRNRTHEPPCPVQEIKIGSLVSAPLDSIYYRAEILECSSTAKLATVILIDYGNQLQVQYSQLRSAIPIMRNLNAFAFRVRLPEDCDSVPQALELESSIIIRVPSSNNTNGIFDVEFKPKSVPLNLPLQIITSNPEVQVKKIFEGGKHALLQYVKNWNTELDMNIFLNSEQGLKLDFSQPPSEGAFVAARTIQGWRRACLLGSWDTKHVYLVYVIDEGCVHLCNQLKKIPSAFLELPMRVFAITVTSQNVSLDECQLVNFGKLSIQMLATITPPSKVVKSLPCALNGDQKKITDVLASTFAGILSELGVKCWTERITDGCEVYITHVLTHAEVFITSAAAKEYSNIFSSLARTCPPYKTDEDIIKGDIVLAALGDTTIYFRAKILSVDNNASTYKVLDLDTGFSCSVSQKNIRKPNLFIRSCPVYVKKIKIAYIEKIPTPIVDNKAFETLGEFQANGVEFIIKYNVGGDNDTVDLLFKTDEQQSLSKQLLPLIFQARSDKKSVCTEGDTFNVTKSPLFAEDTPLPPSPPDTPTVKDAPAEMSSTAPNTITIEAIEILPNLDVNKLKTAADRKTFTLSDLKIIPITEGDNVPLYVLDAVSVSEGYITACDFSNKEFLKKFNDYTAMVSNHGKCSHLQRGYEPKPHEICLTIFTEDGEWYRALCMHVLEDNKYRMMFLDYGNICTVTKQDILQITKDLMFPSNANMCYIDNLPQHLTKEQIEKFVTSCSNGIINCKVQKLEDDNYLIKINNIEKLLA